MPYRDKEKKKEYNKQRYINQKEKLVAQHKEYRLKNKEEIKEQNKVYYIENKEKIKEQNKAYRQTPAGIKSRRIGHWKASGVICDDWDKLYDKYLNTLECENCEIELDTNTSTTKCLDHDHLTGEFRNVLCNSCNVKRG